MKLSKTRINVGLVRYADHYHATNPENEKKLVRLGALVGQDLKEIPRAYRKWATQMARTHGYELHFFEKGLGR